MIPKSLHPFGRSFLSLINNGAMTLEDVVSIRAWPGSILPFLPIGEAERIGSH